MVAVDLGMLRATAYRIYARAIETLSNGNLDVSTRRANCEHRTKYDITALDGLENQSLPESFSICKVQIASGLLCRGIYA